MSLSSDKIIRYDLNNYSYLPVYAWDPLSYCYGNDVNQRFVHGSNADIYGQNSSMCQNYLAQRCASNWDGICEQIYSRHLEDNGLGTVAFTPMYGSTGLTAGDILLRNTAMEKYRVGFQNCRVVVEPFNPIDPDSPLISKFQGRNCVQEYAVDPSTIDRDPVMNRLLTRPRIAADLFINIRNTMMRRGTFYALKGTKLGRFYGMP